MTEASDEQDQKQPTPIYDQMIKELAEKVIDPPTVPRIQLPDICCQPLQQTEHRPTHADRLFRSAMVGTRP